MTASRIRLRSTLARTPVVIVGSALGPPACAMAVVVLLSRVSNAASVITVLPTRATGVAGFGVLLEVPPQPARTAALTGTSHNRHFREDTGAECSQGGVCERVTRPSARTPNCGFAVNDMKNCMIY